MVKRFRYKPGGGVAPFVTGERSLYVSSGIGSGSGSDGLQQALALALAEWILTGDAEVGLRQRCCYGCYSSGACRTPVELDGAVSRIAPRKLTELDPTVQTA